MLRLDFLKNELEYIESSRRRRPSTFDNVSYTRRIETDTIENVQIIGNSNERNNAHSWFKNLKSERSKSFNQHKQMKRHRLRRLNDLKLAFSELYLMLILLKNYQTLNFTGFRKILKKHDKLFENANGHEWW